MKDKKRSMLLHSVWDHTGLKAHFEHMAEKGWLLEKITNWGLVYRRIEPKKLTFCVCYYPKATVFAPEPVEGQETFYEFCRHTGWELAASWAQLQVFYNGREDPVPIETDPVLELDTIHRTAKRTTLLSNGMLFLLALFQGGLFVSGFLRNPVGVLSSSSALFTGLCWVLVPLLTVSEVVAYYRWRAKAKKAAERGESLATNSRIKLQIVCLIVVGIGLLYYFLSVFTSGDPVMMTIMPLVFLGISLVMFLTRATRDFLKRKKVAAKINAALTFVLSFVLSFVLIGGITFGMIAGLARGWFNNGRETYQYHGSVFTVYDDALPLTVEELTGKSYGEDKYTREWRDSASVLLAQYTARQHPRFDAEGYIHLPILEYTVTLVKVPELYDLCKNALLAEYGDDDWLGRSYESIEADPWGAAEAYRVVESNGDRWNNYLLCYPDRLVEFAPGWTMTAEQKALVGEKLGGSGNE